MTEPVPEPQEQSAAPLADAVSQPVSGAEEGQAGNERRQRSRRGGRGRRGNADAGANATAANPSATTPTGSGARTARAQHPLLAQLAQWHPALFGENLLPLKRGIFQDLLDAHAEGLDKDQLKVALSLHTRSSRYLTVVASGQDRHDLAGQSVESMAPEHVHHALVEVFRRRQQRTAEDLRPKLVNRIALAYEASGLSREDYVARVHGRDEVINNLVDEALLEADGRAARDEALLRAFEASGQSEAAFADMYGMGPRQVAQTLERARRRREPAAPAQAGAPVDAQADALSQPETDATAEAAASQADASADTDSAA